MTPAGLPGMGAPQEIYAQVVDHVRAIVQAVAVPAEDPADEAVRCRISANLNKMQAHVEKEQATLAENAEWNRFTVAFYGQTNAGKSTIIETLRILLDEPRKLVQRHNFRELQVRFGLDEEELSVLRRGIEEARIGRGLVAEKLGVIEEEHAVELKLLESRLKQAEQAAIHARAMRPWWKLLLAIFKAPAEDTAARLIASHLEFLQANHATALHEKADELASIEALLVRSTTDLDERTRSLPKLSDFADGAIIGHGLPDFTRENHIYEFDVGDVAFSLIDVPGIEGEQELLLPRIEKAVKTAHAVFYVTREAKPPGTSDSPGGGTLGQIKRHLGAQAEVWAVYNKPMPAPRKLPSEGDVFAGDAVGVAELTKVLARELRGAYRGVVTVGAYPAFLAVADCLVPDVAVEHPSKRLEDRRKFLASFSREELLERTGFAAFVEHLKSTAYDARSKITLANFKKANEVLKGVSRQLDADLAVMEAHAKGVKKETANAQGQVDLAAEQLRARLNIDARDALRRFGSRVRGIVYGQIQNGIENDDLKEALGKAIRSNALTMQEEVTLSFRNATEQFLATVAGVAERFHKHLSDLDGLVQAQQRTLNGPVLKLDLEINDGISIVGLVGSVVSAFLLFVGTGGTATLPAILFGVAGIVISVAKAVWGFFDKEYAKAQQRKAVDKILEGARESFDKDLRSSEAKISSLIVNACDDAKRRLGAPQKNAFTTVNVLRRAVQRLRALSLQIEFTMAHPKEI